MATKRQEISHNIPHGHSALFRTLTFCSFFRSLEQLFFLVLPIRREALFFVFGRSSCFVNGPGVCCCWVWCLGTSRAERGLRLLHSRDPSIFSSFFSGIHSQTQQSPNCYPTIQLSHGSFWMAGGWWWWDLNFDSFVHHTWRLSCRQERATYVLHRQQSSLASYVPYRGYCSLQVGSSLEAYR